MAPRVSSWLGKRVWVMCVLMVWPLPGSRAEAQICTGTDAAIGGFAENEVPRTGNCVGFRCYPPENVSSSISAIDASCSLNTPTSMCASCDPTLGSCSVRGELFATLPGIDDNHDLFFGQPYARAEWFRDGALVGTCGELGSVILKDELRTWVQLPGFSCADPDGVTGAGNFEVVLKVCDVPSLCPEEASETISLSPADIAQALCPQPPKNDCEDCKMCALPGVPTDGTNPGRTVSNSGPDALLSYRAGGVGHPGFPGSTAWNTELGRYWSHDYAERIVTAPDESHVWLLTQLGTFREFSGLEASGPTLRAYDRTLNSPSIEYRTLFFDDIGGGWELRSLDGTVQKFLPNGRWDRTIDRNGNEKVASYNVSGQLERVDFPDARHELFTYYSGDPVQPDDRLATIVEVGIDGTTTRTWTYAWDGLNLLRIDRPDGTAYDFVYGDAGLPGYMTRMELDGLSSGRRVVQAWHFTAEGRVEKTWKGDTSFDGPDAVEKWQLAYGNPMSPTQTTITDPLDEPTVYTYDRDPRSTNPRLQSVGGSCPVCSFGPDTSFEYNDTANPMRPTAAIDGKGTRTEMVYDANGMMTERLETVGEPEARTSTWEYDSNFPQFPTLIRVPSTSGTGFRDTTVLYDSTTGDATLRTISGTEDGAAFSFTTATTYNTEGQPESIDPPGFGTGDETSFVYDPTRGNLLPTTRTDPIVGDTTFAYDAFNRRTGVTDPNSVRTETQYDALDRVRFTIRGSGSAEELSTENRYNEFGDLEVTILPRANRIVYTYDPAGRLLSIERRPDETTPAERTLFELDGIGNRTKEKLQRWDSGLANWVTESETDFDYLTRCQLGFVIRDPAGVASTSEYQYDCNGNLERVWDANHGSLTDPATQLYGYDPLNRLTSIEQPEGSGTVTGYTYDVRDHLTSVTDAEGNVTSYVYGDRDLLSQQTSQSSATTSFTYNEHGALLTETDARNITVTRTPDALDRVEFVDYADDTLDIDYVYDDPGVPFSVGRLTRIIRDTTMIEHTYDQFGRVLQDGALLYSYDANGNRTTVTYPAGAVATYTHDFADRQSTLSVNGTSIVSASNYLPSGPLSQAVLGNGITETRGFDPRYFPASIAVAGDGTDRDWTHTTDGVGNITQIQATVGCKPSDLLINNQTLDQPETFTACNSITLGPNVDVDPPGPVALRAAQSIVLTNDVTVNLGSNFVAAIDPSLVQSSTWTFDYEAPEYYLTEAIGPWGSLAWTYDQIGNRLSEIREGTTEVYRYVANAASGNSPLLDEVDPPGSGLREYDYGPAGHLEFFAAGANEIDFVNDEASRLASMLRLPNDPDLTQLATLTYDGRSFLARAERPINSSDLSFVESTYSSEGVVQALRRQDSLIAPVELFSVFYFAGRPIAQLREIEGQATSEWTFLTTDHLGTPLLATDDQGLDVWAGPFEPFGEDTFGLASDSDVFLRLPGQWTDTIWEQASLGADVYYNVHRWYENGTGRYGRVDPDFAPLRLVDISPYAYVGANPLHRLDSLGLASFVGFPGGRESDARQALERAKQKLQDEPCCSGSRELNQRLLRRLESPRLVIRFDPGEANCGLTPASAVLRLRRRFRVGPAAWDCCIEGLSPIDSLASTFVHEVSHFGGGREERAKEIERRCFGCSTTPTQ